MKPLSILIVDDDVFFRKSIELLLQRAGHQVRCAGDVRTAITAIKETDFDVILTDMLIGEDDGIDVLRAASAKQPRPRVIAMSGGGIQLRASFCLDLAVAFGAVISLTKPFPFDQLLRAIDGVASPTEAQKNEPAYGATTP